jgi:hypothetical protein
MALYVQRDKSAYMYRSVDIRSAVVTKLKAMPRSPVIELSRENRIEERIERVLFNSRMMMTKTRSISYLTFTSMFGKH